MRIRVQRTKTFVALAVGVVTGGCSGASLWTPEDTGTSEQAITTPPPSFPTFQDLDSMIRPVVSVGRDYVYETNTGNVLAYKRNVDANGSINGTTSPTGQSNQQYANIFATQAAFYDAELATINDQYTAAEVPFKVPNCTSSDTSFCTKDFYDGDTVYDEYSGHFFLMTKARRYVWSCADGNVNLTPPPGFDAGWNDGNHDHGCNGAPASYVQKLSGRPIMVAVSQCNAQGTDCENPANGWRTYTLAEDSWDWAQFNVSRGLVMVNYRVPYNATMYPGYVTDGKIWGFSAQSLITGSLTPSFLPNPGFSFVASDFPTTGVDTANAQAHTDERANQNDIMFVELLGATSADWPTVVTMHGKQVWAYNIVPSDPAFLAAAASTPLALGLWDLSPWKSSLQIAPAAVYTLPDGMAQENNAHPVWSGGLSGQSWPGRLYWSFINGQKVSGFMWPMRSWKPSSPAVLSSNTAQGFRQWDVGDMTHGNDFPVLTHNFMSGDNVLLFHQYTLGGSLYNVTPSYTVTGPNDTTFPASVTIQAFTGSFKALPSAGGAVDILSNVSDPIRPQVFMTSVASNGSGFTPYVTAVKMPDGVVNSPLVTASPSSLQIPPGAAMSTFISFTGLGQANVSAPLPTCTAGGDLGAPLSLNVTQQGATVTIAMPQNASGSFVEGISCTNGVSVTVPITAAPPLVLACSGGPACTSETSAQTNEYCDPVSATSDWNLQLQRQNGGSWQTVDQVVATAGSPTSMVDTYSTPNTYGQFTYRACASNSVSTVCGTSFVEPTMTSCACSTTVVCKLPSGQIIYPTVNSPPNWCSSRGGHYVTKPVCPFSQTLTSGSRTRSRGRSRATVAARRSRSSPTWGPSGRQRRDLLR